MVEVVLGLRGFGWFRRGRGARLQGVTVRYVYGRAQRKDEEQLRLYPAINGDSLEG
jgi:hypothetical protein